MSRPRGEIRAVLRCAFAAAREPLTWRSVAQATQVGYSAAQRTVENMARAGELQLVQRDGRAGLYQLVAVEPGAALHVAPLEAAVRSWREFK